ncbi:MAG: alanine racemase, partial [Acidobacteria bacterium]|nr:alanine racemase [Acidobacteriota bacterium]
MHRTWAEISLDRIAANYHALRAEAGEQVITAPVVKANAYGHGSAEVARRLEAEGAPWFCVSNADEGVVLRDAGISARILVMGGFLDFERETMLGYDLTPVVHCPAQLRDLDRLAGHSGCSLTYHLKLDTGMGRLGARAPLPELIEAVRQARHAHLEGLMTHFASANDFVSGQTAEQMAGFESAVQTFRAAG